MKRARCRVPEARPRYWLGGRRQCGVMRVERELRHTPRAPLRLRSVGYTRSDRTQRSVSLSSQCLRTRTEGHWRAGRTVHPAPLFGRDLTPLAMPHPCSRPLERHSGLGSTTAPCRRKRPSSTARRFPSPRPACFHVPLHATWGCAEFGDWPHRDSGGRGGSPGVEAVGVRVGVQTDERRTQLRP